jgi:hypothetical protein
LEKHSKGSQALLRRREEDDADDAGHSSALGRSGTLDPLVCQMAVGPAITLAAGPLQTAPQPAGAVPIHEELQQLVSGLARKVAWGGDRRKGSARIELSEGPLAGATLIVHTEQRSVTVELELPAGAGAADDLRQRILGRLEERGFAARVRVG